MNALRSGLRSYDLVMRYCGDEFVCVLPNTNINKARERFADMSDTLAADPSAGSISVGFAELSDGDSSSDLISRADGDLLAQRQQRR